MNVNINAAVARERRHLENNCAYCFDLLWRVFMFYFRVAIAVLVVGVILHWLNDFDYLHNFACQTLILTNSLPFVSYILAFFLSPVSWSFRAWPSRYEVLMQKLFSVPYMGQTIWAPVMTLVPCGDGDAFV